MNQTEANSPAARVAARFGSFAALGRIPDVGVSRNTARNWRRIPTEHHGAVMAAARDLDPPLEWWELTMLPDEALRHGHISLEQHASIVARELGTSEAHVVAITREAAPRQPDPAAVAAAIATLGGRDVVSEGTRIADTVIEAMEEAGVIFTQHHRAFAEFALEQGFHLDPSDPASFRPLGRRAWDRRSA